MAFLFKHPLRSKHPLRAVKILPLFWMQLLRQGAQHRSHQILPLRMQSWGQARPPASPPGASQDARSPA